jgi:transcriptional regulator with XRE-family HTH domain
MADRTRHILSGFESELGYRLRGLRRARRLSLNEVANATGVSPSFISHIENGKSDITIGRLMRLAHFYEVELKELLPTESTQQPYVVRAGRHPAVHSPTEGLDVFLLGPDLGQHMIPCLTVYEEGGKTDDFFSGEGENFLFVLKGEVTVAFQDGSTIILRRGDSAYYRTERPHTFANTGKGPAKMLSCAALDAGAASDWIVVDRRGHETTRKGRRHSPEDARVARPRAAPDDSQPSRRNP